MEIFNSCFFCVLINIQIIKIPNTCWKISVKLSTEIFILKCVEEIPLPSLELYYFPYFLRESKTQLIKRKL